MSGAINPLDNPQAWDTFIVGQVACPGYCEVTGFKRANEWDIKKGKGTAGATITFVGKPPAQGTVKFYLWTVTHFQQWDIFRKLLKYDATKKTVTAVDVYHPALADIDVKSIVVEDLGAIEHEGKQMYSITISCIEYFPAQKKSSVSTANGSTPTQSGTTPGNQSDPIADAQQKEIARLLAKAQEP